MHSSQLVNQSGNLSVSQLGPEVTLWKLKKKFKWQRICHPIAIALILRTSPLIDLFYKQTGIDRNFIQMCILYFHHDAWKFPNHHAPSPFQMIFQYFKPFYSLVLNSKWAGTDSSDSPGSLEMESQ